jgi:hypothetical protein
MATANTVWIRGLDPEENSVLPTRVRGLIGASTIQLFKNSAVRKTGGYIVGCPNSAQATHLVTGSLSVIYDSAGFPLHAIPSAPTEGVYSCEYTNDADQRYRITYAGVLTQADLSKGGNLTDESATAATSVGYGSLTGLGAQYSNRQLATTLVADGSQAMFNIEQLTPVIFGNDLSPTGTTISECWVKINPANYID